MARPRLLWLSLLLLQLVPISEADEAIWSLRMRPDGSYPHPSDKPVRFTFAPQANVHGVEVQRFRISVYSFDANHLVSQRDFSGPTPSTFMSLEPGRYRWALRWWSASGAESEESESEVLVAPAPAVWDGVPWLGSSAANEFKAEVNLGRAASQRVELMVSTLGFGYVTISGKEISKDILSYAGWTNTEKRVLYRSYDVTSHLNSSAGGVILVRLGCGYRCDPANRFPAYKDHGNPPRDSIPKIFRLQLRVGDALAFHSGSSGWLARRGPTVQDSVYGGEIFAPRAATSWEFAQPLPTDWGPSGIMVPANFPGVQITRVDTPISIAEPAPGVHVVDFGSNVAGVCRISVPNAATISMKHGELLQHVHLPDLKSPDPGRVYFGNLRSAEANDTLVLDGPVTDWWPRFTYHGFRYVEVYGYPGKLSQQSISRLMFHTVVEDKASANFSDEVLQAIHEGSKGSQRSNLMQLPTDCPQRDERLGWMGDASLSVDSMMLHFDYTSMAEAFVDTMVDEMISGSLPDVVPYQRGGGRPADLSWSAAFLGSLHSMWKSEALLDASRRHWQSIQAHTAHLIERLAQAQTLKDLPEPYGDWCPPPATPGKGETAERPGKPFAAAFSIVRSLQQAADLAKALGHTKEASDWAAKAAAQTTYFHNVFWDAGAERYDNGAMITYVLPLALAGAVPDANRELLANALAAHIHARNGTWSGGIINNRFLFDVLHEHGHADLALAMLKRRDYPSYGYMYFNDLEPAKECMWELPDAPFEGTGMNSRNHHMFSSVGHYLITRVAGLSLDSRRGELVAVAGREGSASVRLRLSEGDARFAWTYQGSSRGVQVDMTVPIGLKAQLHLPLFAGRPVVDGVVAEYVVVVHLHGSTYHKLVLAAGKYQITAKQTRAQDSDSVHLV